MVKEVKVVQYKWAGKFWPFKIKTHCGECDMTTGILKALIKDEFKGKPVTLDIRNWLDNWYKPIWKGGWHAPIVMVDGKIITQGKTTNKNLVREYIKKRLKR
jgi:disulfide oxidoreductase YuzD